jgi:allophanate hydrolase
MPRGLDRSRNAKLAHQERAARQTCAPNESIMTTAPNLSIATLRSAYRAGTLQVGDLVEQLLERAERIPDRSVWITRIARPEIMRRVDALAGCSIDALPLYGIPFVIKDNIDLAGVKTTAGCPDYAYLPVDSAPVVQRLIAAGAIPLGKTNLDQFATGLSGNRSPYGACRNSFDENYISGGSSSGSAVAVATGLASFSLGTDTAGSGRVPAAFNNLIGLKPTIGRLSARGVVPACRSLDCVSIFALTAEDAAAVLDAAEGYDREDAYSRELGNTPIDSMRFGVPRRDQLEFFGDAEYARLFDAAALRVESLGAIRVEIDFAPFLSAARLLYEGPWIAERYAAVGDFLESHPGAVHPITRALILGGKLPTASDAYRAQYRLKELQRASEAAWSRIDWLLTPTAGTIYTIQAVEADPIRLNATLGRYTNFMNFLDLAGVAVPSGFRADGLPFGVTLVGPQSSERALLRIAGRMHRASAPTLGALGLPLPAYTESPGSSATLQQVPIAVCGAHMQGLPLNSQLHERGARLLQKTRTAPHYRLYALPGGPPHRPGLIRVASQGAPIELEVWALPAAEVGSFIEAIPAPLGVGKVELADGTIVAGFICEGYAAAGAIDITDYGGWHGYLEAQPVRT